MLFIFVIIFCVYGVCTHVSADACTCVSTCRDQRMMMSVLLCRSLTLFLRQSLSPYLKITFRLSCPIAQSPPKFFLSLPPTVGVIGTQSGPAYQFTFYGLLCSLFLLCARHLLPLIFSVYSLFTWL